MYAIWITVVLLIALIAWCIIMICLKKRLCCFKNRGKPKPNVAQDVEDLSGVHGSRNHSFGAATGSEIEMFDGIAVSDGHRRALSAINPNWSPADTNIVPRRNTPEPVDRSNVLRTGDHIEIV